MDTTQTHLSSNPSSTLARPTAAHQHKELWPAQLPKNPEPASISWRLAPCSLVYAITLSYTHCLWGKARQRGGLFRQGLFCCMK